VLYSDNYAIAVDPVPIYSLGISRIGVAAPYCGSAPFDVLLLGVLVSDREFGLTTKPALVAGEVLDVDVVKDGVLFFVVDKVDVVDVEETAEEAVFSY
jgi:hypothetical protein